MYVEGNLNERAVLEYSKVKSGHRKTTPSNQGRASRAKKRARQRDEAVAAHDDAALSLTYMPRIFP
jgi:hypothetical protein